MLPDASFASHSASIVVVNDRSPDRRGIISCLHAAPGVPARIQRGPWGRWQRYGASQGCGLRVKRAGRTLPPGPPAEGRTTGESAAVSLAEQVKPSFTRFLAIVRLRHRPPGMRPGAGAPRQQTTRRSGDAAVKLRGKIVAFVRPDSSEAVPFSCIQPQATLEQRHGQNGQAWDNIAAA